MNKRGKLIIIARMRVGFFSKKVQKNKASQFLSFLKKFDIEKCPIHVNIEFVVHTAEPSGKCLLDYVA